MQTETAEPFTEAWERRLAELNARREAAPTYWLVFITTEDQHDHALFATSAEAENFLLEYLRESYDPTIADLEDAEERIYGDKGVWFNILEAPLGFWAESI